MVHKSYTDAQYDADIAIIRLPRALTFNDYVLPVCFHGSPVPAIDNCIVAGWIVSSKLNQTFVEYSTIYTSALYVANKLYQMVSHDGHLCLSLTAYQ